MNHINAITVAIAIGLSATSANAAVISLTPTTASAPQGGQVTFDVIADFEGQSTVGGTFDVQWDSSVIGFNDFAFDPSFSARDPDFDVEDLQLSNLLNIGFGNLSGLSITSDTVIGTLTFDVTGAPGMETAVTLLASGTGDPFFDSDSLEPINPNYFGATAMVADTAPIPLPAASWLLMGGLVGLFGAARRRKK